MKYLNGFLALVALSSARAKRCKLGRYGVMNLSGHLRGAFWRLIFIGSIWLCLAMPALAEQEVPEPGSTPDVLNCRQPLTSVDETICSSSQLLILDRQVEAAYQRALSQLSNPQQVQTEQQDWLISVRNVCVSQTCLARAFLDRRFQLYQQLDAFRRLSSGPVRFPVRSQPALTRRDFTQKGDAGSIESESSSSLASFDCAQAQKEVEQLICGSSELRTLDHQLGEIYHRAWSRLPDRHRLHAEQLRWLMTERNVCVDQECLKQAYRSRHSELTRQLEMAASKPKKPEEAGDSSSPSSVSNVTSSAPVVRSPTNQASDEGTKLRQDGWKVLGVSSAVAFIVLLVLGLTNRVVIFFDVKDLIASVAAIVGVPLAGCIAVFMDSKFFQDFFLTVGILISLAGLFLCFRNAMRYNTPLLGILIGCFKILVSLLGMLLLYMTGKQTNQKDRTTADWLEGIATVGLVAYCSHLLVNGERVLNLRAKKERDARFYEDFSRAKRQAEGQQSQDQGARYHERDDDRKNHKDETREPTWYEILGVAESASFEDIKKAFRKKMSEYHPDKTSGLGDDLRELAEQKAKEINRAYKQAQKARGMAA